MSMEETESDPHKCKPEFLVWPTDFSAEHNGVIVRAFDHEEAAERWAEEDDRDSADYQIVGGSPATERFPACCRAASLG